MNYSQLTYPTLGLFLALGLSLSGYFISHTILNGEVAVNTAEVKGLATRKVEADTVSWDLEYTVHTTNKSQLEQLYNKANSHKNLIVQLLKESGFTESEVQVGVLVYAKQEFRNKEQKVIDQKHVLTGKISVHSLQVRQVANVRARLNVLIAKGLEITNYDPVYRYTKLNEIKPAMLQEATKNAKVAANEFAQIAGVQVGGIRWARQGNFSVSDIGSHYSDSRTIEKEVRVVTTITFFLED